MCSAPPTPEADRRASWWPEPTRGLSSVAHSLCPRRASKARGLRVPSCRAQAEGPGFVFGLLGCPALTRVLRKCPSPVTAGCSELDAGATPAPASLGSPAGLRLCSKQTCLAMSSPLDRQWPSRGRRAEERRPPIFSPSLAGALQPKTGSAPADAVISPHQGWELVYFPGSHLSIPRWGGRPRAVSVSIIFDCSSYGA